MCKRCKMCKRIRNGQVHLDFVRASGWRSKQAKDLPADAQWRLKRARVKEMAMLLQKHGTVRRVRVKQEVVA